jgi:hypothetical protein
MIEGLLALSVFVIVFFCLAIGVLYGKHGIEGSCGGLNRIPGLKVKCACGHHPPDHKNPACPHHQRSHHS